METIIMIAAKEALEQRDTILDEYEKNIGISSFQAPGNSEELEQYLNMDRKALEALSIDACDSISYRLAQFAFHIQRAQNRENSRATWAQNQIKLTIADQLDNYKGYGYEEKYYQAVKGNEHAFKLNSIMIYAQQRAARLNFTANSVKHLADILKATAINKRSVNV